MLFNEYQYFQYTFPEPQYLGSKYKLLPWIAKYIPKNIKVALDAFSGTQSVAFLFKQLGLKVITNDFLHFNHQIGLALIENKNIKLSTDDIQFLFNENSQKDSYSLMETVFTNVFFERSESVFLDNLRANINVLENRYKKALALVLVNRSLNRKITMEHFGHTQALIYAATHDRIKRNPNLIRPIKKIMLDLIPSYHNSIFDNKMENVSYSENILDLLPKLVQNENIDLVYFDPPYCDSHADYQSFYHLPETYTQYWTDKQFINGIKRYEPQIYSGFDKKKDILLSMDKLFEYAQDIPTWLISYNNRSFPNIEVLKSKLERYKEVVITTKKYTNSRGGKGSVAGSEEVLFICTPKKNY